MQVVVVAHTGDRITWIVRSEHQLIALDLVLEAILYRFSTRPEVLCLRAILQPVVSFSKKQM